MKWPPTRAQIAGIIMLLGGIATAIAPNVASLDTSSTTALVGGYLGIVGVVISYLASHHISTAFGMMSESLHRVADASADPEGPGDPDLFPEIPVDTSPANDQGEAPIDAEALARVRKQALSYSSSVSGLSSAHRKVVRAAWTVALNVSFRHSGSMGYTQSASRWMGIARRLLAALGQFPTSSDCSSWASWVLWNGLRLFHVRDLVNGLSWEAGNTQTMLMHGKIVHHEKNIQLGDIAIYNDHCAVCIGGGFVLSHGQPGVAKRPLHYRPDLISIRRYV